MPSLSRAKRSGGAVAVIAIGFVALVPLFAGSRFSYSEGIEAPFGQNVSASVTNYHRITPVIATAGLLKDGAVAELKALGFVAVLDLRGPEEGTDIEKGAAEAVGLHYFNIPVTEQAPTEAQVQVFRRTVEQATNYPLLVHCQTANRVGAIWTLYRVSKGVPFAIAVEEGRGIGLQPGREKAVRARLGEPLTGK